VFFPDPFCNERCVPFGIFVSASSPSSASKYGVPIAIGAHVSFRHNVTFRVRERAPPRTPRYLSIAAIPRVPKMLEVLMTAVTSETPPSPLDKGPPLLFSCYYDYYGPHAPIFSLTVLLPA
jgi:hypothetical protein